MFDSYIGIEYSGAQTPTASLGGLRVYLAKGDAPPAESKAWINTGPAFCESSEIATLVALWLP